MIRIYSEEDGVREVASLKEALAIADESCEWYRIIIPTGHENEACKLFRSVGNSTWEFEGVMDEPRYKAFLGA